MQFPFFNFSYCVILLFDHKEYLQSFDAESSMPTDILSFKMMVVLMPTNTAGRDLKDHKCYSMFDLKSRPD